MSFVDSLAISVSLTISGTTYAISGGDVKGIRLDWQGWGFRARVDFVKHCEKTEDDLLDAFIGDELIDVELEFGTYEHKTDLSTAEKVKVKGIATLRDVREQTVANVYLTGDPILHRHYFVEFADPAQVLWKQHFPCELRTESTLQTLLSAHTGTKITLVGATWPLLQETHHMIALSLGAYDHQASFYDFLIWFTDRNNGVFAYDGGLNSYALSSIKVPLSGAVALDPVDIEDHQVEFPQAAFHQPRVLNAYSESPQTNAVENSQGVDPIHHDFLVRMPVAADLQTRTTLETDRLKLRKHEVVVQYRKFPLQPKGPGKFVKFDGPKWSSTLYVHGKSYRVRSWQFHAGPAPVQEGDAAESDTLDHGLDYGIYRVEFTQRLECLDETWVDLPDYHPPRYPIYVEGKVVSSAGEETDATYVFNVDDTTSAEYYQVKVPVWEDLQVRAPYEPSLLTGQFYFPLYKHARVLLGLNLHDAYIVECLDWRTGARLPMDTQGNHWVMGKSTTSQTELKHVYVDEKPEFTLLRTEGSDTELLKMSEGSILLQTKEEAGS